MTHLKTGTIIWCDQGLICRNRGLGATPFIGGLCSDRQCMEVQIEGYVLPNARITVHKVNFTIIIMISVLKTNKMGQCFCHLWGPFLWERNQALGVTNEILL